MAASKQKLVATILRRGYWPLAIFLSLAVWAGLTLALRPWRDRASAPYGLNTASENRALDLLFQLRDVRRPWLRQRGLNEPITVIEIDEATIKASGVRLQQWRRDWYAHLIDRANKAGAAVIGLDVLLSEEGGTSLEYKQYDQLLVRAMTDAGNVVIGAKLAAGGTPAINPLPQFSTAAYAVGFVDIAPDSDGFVRSAQLVRAVRGGETDVSFATWLATAYLAAHLANGETPPVLTALDDENMRLGQRLLPVRTDRNLQIDFRAGPHTHSEKTESESAPGAFRHISAVKVLDDKTAIDDEVFRDLRVKARIEYVSALVVLGVEVPRITHIETLESAAQRRFTQSEEHVVMG